MPHIYNKKIASRSTPSTIFIHTALCSMPGINLTAYVGMSKKKTIANTMEKAIVRAISVLVICSSSSPAACAE